MSPADSQLIANARMYSVAPGAAAAWKRLFAWLTERSGIGLTVIDHAFPEPLHDLWSRHDLACTFMCGWPFMRFGAVHRIVAAPVPKATYAKGRPVYCSHFVVGAVSGFKTLQDTFGHRVGYTIPDSHSGFNAPRHHLMKFRGRDARPLYREIVGPLMTPRLVVQAVGEGRVDVGPVDSFAFDLLCRYAPELTDKVRVVASTDVVPIPAFVAAKGTPPATIERLAETLCSIGADADQAGLRDDLCISGFARIGYEDYGITEDWAREAESKGLAQVV